MNNRAFLLERMERFLRSRFPHDSSQPKGELMRPSMTISRQCGAGVDRIGPGLIEYLDANDESTDLGWALFNQSLIGKIIEDQKLPPSLEPFLIENTKFPIVEALEEVLNLHPSNWTLFNHSANTIRKLCKMGNAIVVGRAGNFVTSDLHNTFHVRLTASEDLRIHYTAERYGISQKEARKLVIETDKGRARYVKRYTGADIDDLKNYDFCLNTDTKTDEELVTTLGEAILDWSSHRSPGLNKIAV